MSETTPSPVPEVTLGEYKGLKVKKAVQPVTEAAVDKELQRILDQNAKKCEITHRPIENGDIATIDFEGFVDGVAFEGGKGEQVDLEIGSKTFIPGFEEQLIGKKAGESFDINVHFPEGYGGPDLSGRPAVFKIKVHQISSKSVPDANDAFASEVAGVPNMQEFRGLIRGKLEVSAETAAEQAMLDDLLSQIIHSSTFILSDELIETEAKTMLAEYRQQLQGRGISLENYLEMMGQSMDQFLAGMKEPAAMRAKSTMAIRAIAGLEGITASEAEMEKEFNEISSLYNIPVEDLKKRFHEDDLAYIKAVIVNKKVFEILLKETILE